MTRTSDKTFNVQQDPARLSYEVQELTRIFLAEDRAALARLMETTLSVMEVLEQARQSAGIRYPGE